MLIDTLPEMNHDIQNRLNRLTADDIVIVNNITGPQSIAVSLADLFNDYLKSNASIEKILRDAGYFALINRAVMSSHVEHYISGVLYAGDESQRIDQADRIAFFRTLCRLAVEHELPGTLNVALADLRATAPAYKAFSLANTLWNAWPQLNRVNAVWVAAFILYDELNDMAQTPALEPEKQPLDLRGYQDLRTVVDHLLSDQPGETLIAKLMNLLPMDILRTSSGKFRIASRKEVAEGADLLPGRKDGMAFFPGATLTHTADLALNAVLNCSSFIAWQNRLVEALEWYAPEDSQQASPAMSQQLAVQALIDCIYPIEQRRAGYILDVHFFAPDNADCSLYDIRINLTNSLGKTLGCVNADAQIITQLLLMRFAPELLLTDAPEDFRYQPDLRWANLRHALRLRPPASHTQTFAEWEMLPARLAADATKPEDRLHIAMARTEAMIVWGIYAKVINDQRDYLPDELGRLARHFESACDRHALNALPDRLNDARQLLDDAGIDPDAINAHSGTTELEAYLDNGTDYSPSHALKGSLPEATQRFNQAFDHYLKDARQTYTNLTRLFLDELPVLDQERLLFGKLTCYAVEWRQYVGPVTGGTPAYASSPEHHWQACRGGHGCVVHVVHEEQHFLYELFPERNVLRHHVVNTHNGEVLDGMNLPLYVIERLIEPDHGLYNGEPLRHDKSLWPTFVRLPATPDIDNRQQLLHALVESVFLHHIDALRTACKGTTKKETQTRLREATSDATYAWNLIKSVIPIVGCFDVRTGGDAAGCVADVAGEIGTVMTIAGRTFKPLIKLGGKARLRSFHPASLLNPRKQNAKWFAGRHDELNQFERQVLAASDAVATGEYVQRRGMFQRVWAEGLAGSTRQFAKVDGVDNVLVRNISTAETPDYRWWNPHDQKSYGPRLSAIGDTPAIEARTFATTQGKLLPGQFPGAVELDEIGEHGYDLSVTSNRNIRLVRRDKTVTDLIIDDVSYRFDDNNQNGILRKVELESTTSRLNPLDEVPTVCKVKRDLTEVSCAGALILMSTPRPVSDLLQAPLLLGEHASHAFMTRRFRPVLQRMTRRGYSRPKEIHLLVDDGKISTWIDEMIPARDGPGTPRAGRKILAAVPPHEALQLGLTTPPQYRTTINGRLMKDQTLGLPDSFDDIWRAQIDQKLPVVQLDSICRTINDQREMRGIRLSFEDGKYIAVEADTGQFYKAEEHLSDMQLQFTRMTSETEIDAYLNISEAYRLGANRRTLNKDMDNIARMLFEMNEPGVDMERIYPSYASILEGHARSILTDTAALENFVTLTRSSIPNFKQMADVDPIMRQHVASVLDALLPATGSKQPWVPLPSVDLALKTTGENIRTHLKSTNLAFLLAETSDKKHHVYYALAGGKRGKTLTLRTPVPHEESGMTFIDARERMKGQAPDPAFTSLPVIRTAEKLCIREHDRYLDAERLIATAFKEDMRLNPSLTKIHFFTLMDTCNSCGGFVLPRLKLDFPYADFSVSYILPYTPPT